MSPWLEAFGVTLLAGTGVWLGHWFSRRPKHYWLLGYFLPLVLVLLYDVANHVPAFAFVPPVSWMMVGRHKFAVIGFIAAMVLTTPLSRLSRKCDRIMVSILIVVIVWLMSVWPFLAPAFNRHYLAGLQTSIDADGVCRQSNDYTCGPAAAVTALRKLGLPAEEGAIAILAHASSSTGTEADVLAQVLQNQYGKDGLVAEYRIFKDVEELKLAGLTIAQIRFSFMIDHFVTVLEVTDRQVIVGDPLNGRTTLSYDEFNHQWRFSGVVLKRNIQL